MAGCPITLEMRLAEAGAGTSATNAQSGAHDADSCPQCQQQQAWIARFFSAMRDAERLTVPDAALERANALFRETFTRARRPLQLARLIFDSLSGPRPAFARDGEPAAWQRLYQAETCRVELWQEGGAGQEWYVIGQILPERGDAPTGISEALFIASDGAVRRVEIKGGEFHADRLPADTYQICLQSPEASALLADVRIGA